MLFEIASLLLSVAVGLLGGACLLRLWMQALRVPFGNPVGQLVFALTDWIVLPLRRVLPAMGRWDTASLVAAVLLKVLHMAVLLALLPVTAARAWSMLPVLSLVGAAQMALTTAMVVLIVQAVLSWVQPHSPFAAIAQRLTDPLLAPIRRVMPTVGGFDLSPLVAVVALQVLQIVLDHASRGMLRF
jgi:YggT family protein